MPSFNDSTGRTWQIKFDFDTTRRVRQATGLKLSRDDLSPFVELENSIDLQAAALWVLVEREAGEREISQTEFFKALNGDAMAAGVLAIREAAIEFAPASARELMREAFKRIDEAIESACEEACRRIDAIQFDPAAFKFDPGAA